MSLYAQYVAEKTNKFILETDKGFATYSFPNAATVYLEDIYVAPEHRESGIATILVDSVEKIAKERGCTKLLGSVYPSHYGSTQSLKIFLHMGAQLESASNDFIVISRSL